MASSTRPCWLTHVKRYLTAFYTVMVTLNGNLPCRLDQSIAARNSNWFASFQSLHMICLLVCLDCALEVAIKYNKSLKLINPDHFFLDGAAEAFMKVQLAYTEWNAARARQGWSHPAAPSAALVNSDSRHHNNRPSTHGGGWGGLGARPPLVSQSTRPGILSSEQVQNRLPRGPILQTCLKL